MTKLLWLWLCDSRFIYLLFLTTLWFCVFYNIFSDSWAILAFVWVFLNYKDRKRNNKTSWRSEGNSSSAHRQIKLTYFVLSSQIFFCQWRCAKPSENGKRVNINNGDPESVKYMSFESMAYLGGIVHVVISCHWISRYVHTILLPLLNRYATHKPVHSDHRLIIIFWSPLAGLCKQVKTIYNSI